MDTNGAISTNITVVRIYEVSISVFVDDDLVGSITPGRDIWGS